MLYCAVCWVAAHRAHDVSFPVWPLLRDWLALGALVLTAHASFLRPVNPYGCKWSRMADGSRLFLGRPARSFYLGA